MESFEEDETFFWWVFFCRGEVYCVISSIGKDEYDREFVIFFRELVIMEVGGDIRG